MITQQFISHQNLVKLLVGIIAGGSELFAPLKAGEKRFFNKVTDVDQIDMDPLPTTESPKALLLPRVERLISFDRAGDTVAIDDRSADVVPQRVLFGARPCDAAGLKRLADFFSAEIADAFVQKRREHLIVISLSCTLADADCFCTSTGSGPGDATGSDVLLTAVDSSRYLIESFTERGREVLDRYASLLERSEPIEKARFLACVAAVPELEGFTRQLAGAFDHQLWQETSLRCLGCGACAFVCPVCSCFDVEDEGTPAKGDRLRCWDSCGFSLFTLHTSGHNPRPTQSERWRQRVMHKFSYMPERLGFAGCVGCGRCSRACPADMNLKEQIVTIASRIAEQGVQ
jgi:sulfhydrogenase subunit beta (sulfur reductase)